jgi:hypothetical protein
MKKLIFLLLLLPISFTILCQEEWYELSPNTISGLNTAQMDIEMLNGKIYEFYTWNNGTGVVIQASRYNSVSGYWDLYADIAAPSMTKVITEKIGDIIYVASYDGTAFYFYKLNTVTKTFEAISAPFSFTAVNDNWTFHAGKNANELYVLFSTGTGPSVIHGLEYIGGTSSWSYLSESSSSQNLALADLQIQSSTSDVYFGVYSNKLRITRFVKGNINIMYSYDGLLGEVNSNGSPIDNRGFALTGNLVDLPSLYVTEDANNLSYEISIDGSTIDINLADTPTDYNLSADYLAKESSASHAFIMSQFSTNGIGNPNDKLFVISRDLTQAGSVWDTLADRLTPLGTTIDVNSFKLSIDNNYQHIAASFAETSFLESKIKVYNRLPDVNLSTIDANVNLCASNMNVLYPNIEISDPDFDRIRITDAYALNGTVLNLSVIPIGFVNGVSKFKVVGIPDQLQTWIVISYTDGYGTYNQTLNSFAASGTIPNISFTSDPVSFCSNQQQVDLTEFVNYVDRGRFRLNGNLLDNTVLDALTLNQINSTGFLRYTVEVDGCIVTTNANYQIVAPPTLQISSTPSTCGLNTGSVSAIITAGASSSTNFYWSTGQTNTTLNNLPPGPVYGFINDGNNCHATAMANVEASNISFTETIVNPTCYNSNDGSINVAVTGSTAYQIIWSTGHNTSFLENRTGGVYDYTFYDTNGCQISRTVSLINPIKPTYIFVINKPDCGASNGAVVVNTIAGNSPFTFAWSNGVNTPLNNNITQGKYVVEIRDLATCLIKDSVFVNDNFAPILSDSIILTQCNLETGGINLSIEEHPLGGAVQSISWSTDESTEDIYNIGSGNYTVIVKSDIDCTVEKEFFIGVIPPLRNDICVVSVDTATTSNLVVWEKPQTDEISYFNIFRENSVAGNFIKIDTVEYSNLSVFNDVVASPTQRSWKYRIKAVNQCNVEGPFSIAHKTLHLNAIEQLTPGVFDIYWDRYEGLSSGTYIVLRHTDLLGWEELSPTVPFGGTTQFTDTPSAGSTGIDYFVDFELGTPCTATYRAQDFNRSRSNKDKAVFNPGDGTGHSNNDLIELGTESGNITVQPNPFNSQLLINLDKVEFSKITIINLEGRVLIEKICQIGENTINTSDLKPGTYFLSAELNGKFETIKLIK